MVLMSLLITNFTPCSSVSMVNFRQANANQGKYLWHKGCVINFTISRICVMRLIIAIHFCFFCKFYLLSSNYVKTRGNNYDKSVGVMNMINYIIVISINYKHRLMAAYVNRNWLLQSRFLFDRRFNRFFRIIHGLSKYRYIIQWLLLSV